MSQNCKRGFENCCCFNYADSHANLPIVVNFLLLFVPITTQFSSSYLGDAFDYLDGPIFRVTGADIPMPYAQLLESNTIPQVQNVVLTVKKSLNLA